MSEIKNECAMETIIRKSGLPELLTAAQALVEIVEGVSCWPWVNKNNGFRFKDAPAWVEFYVAVKTAEERSKTDAPLADEAVMKSIERLQLDTLTQTVEAQGREILKAFEFIESLGRDLNTRMLKIERAQPSPYAPPDPAIRQTMSDEQVWLQAWCAGAARSEPFRGYESGTIMKRCDALRFNADECLTDFRERFQKDGK